MIDYDNGNKLFICHFPGRSEILQELVEKEIKHPFHVDSNITIICAFNNDCKNKIFDNVCSTTNVLFEKEALEKEWKMEDKIGYLLKSLKRCKTEYALITDVRDVVITANLDNEFVSKFEAMNCDIVYNATTSKYPKVNLLSDYLIEGGSGPFKYLNAGVCFGRTKELIDWYEYCNTIVENNRSEQFIIRSKYNPIFKIKIDGERKLFRSCHAYDTIFFKDKKEAYLAYSKDAYIEVNKKLRYKRILPNGKLQKGKIKIESLNENRLYFDKKFEAIISDPDGSAQLIKKYAEERKTKLVTLVLDYLFGLNEENYKKLIPVLKVIDRLIIEAATTQGLEVLLRKIKEPEFNCINKIQINISSENKDIKFPYDERLIIKYNSDDDDGIPRTRKFKIIDTKHSGYYKIKLSDKEELINFCKKNHLIDKLNNFSYAFHRTYFVLDKK